MPLSRRRMSSKHEVTPGVPESSGDRNAGIATWRTPIGRQRCRGSGQMLWGRIRPYGCCASRREIDIPIDAGLGANLWISRWKAHLLDLVAFAFPLRYLDPTYKAFACETSDVATRTVPFTTASGLSYQSIGNRDSPIVTLRHPLFQ
jgi:hypothetical protein